MNDRLFRERTNWTDDRHIRERFGVPPTWKLEEQFGEKEHPYPNCLIHEKPAETYSHEGGTNFLGIGEKGSGKSTFGLEWATRLMDANGEAVIWRGSQSRSEWLPLKPWTTLMLPEGADVEANWRPLDIRKDAAGESADLWEHVDDVVYYDDLEDLLSKLEPRQFHVVYPDPTFAGCQQVMDESDYCQHPVEFTPESAAEDPQDETPLVHWWFAFCVARLEYGPYDWTSLIFDECADLAPDSARADRNQTYEKVVALRRVMADSRKYFFSLFFFAHHEENLHSKIRRTIQWRVDMPDGTANPCQQHNDSPPVGFSQIPMRAPMMARQNVGRGLFWTETNFTRFTWEDYPDWDEDQSRWLNISLSDPNAPRARGSMRGESRGLGD